MQGPHSHRHDRTGVADPWRGRARGRIVTLIVAILLAVLVGGLGGAALSFLLGVL
jgi:hypothetical protein